MKKILLLNMLISSLLLCNDIKVEDMSIIGKKYIIERVPTQYEREMLILNIPIKINNLYVRFKDIKNIEIKKDKVICTIIRDNAHNDFGRIEVKDEKQKKFIIELFEKQRKDIVDILSKY